MSSDQRLEEHEADGWSTFHKSITSRGWLLTIQRPHGQPLFKSVGQKPLPIRDLTVEMLSPDSFSQGGLLPFALSET